jgi:hypothetical protein
MKKLMLLMSVLFLFSCSTSEDGEGDDQNVADAKGKLLKSVTEVNESSGSLFCAFYYEDNILMKYNYGENGFYVQRYQLAYEDKKIKRLAFDEIKYDQVEKEDFSYNYNFTNNPNTETISYSNNSIFYQSRYRDYTYNLSNQNQVITILEDSSLEVEFTYSGNQVVKQKTYKYATNTDYTFTVDDKINPFYELYVNFGFVDDYACPFDGHAQLYYNLSSHNITKVYKDGTLLYSFIYQYDSENYPTSVVAYDHSRNETRQHTFTYVN